jgi:pyruvate carboxylase
MADLDLKDLQFDLEEKLGTSISGREITELDALSAALYPKVFEDYWRFFQEYGDLSSLPTRYFLTPLKIGDEFTFDLSVGKTLIIELMAVGKMNDDSKRRDVYFNLNGILLFFYSR